MAVNAINDDELKGVSGGRVVGTTSYGYPVDDNGNVTFTDKTGASVVLTAGQWNSLKSHYAHTQGNPEAYIKDVTIKELQEAQLIPSNPFGI